MSNPNTDTVILQALANTLIATPGTAFTTQNGTYFIEDEYALSAAASYPLLHLMGGSQTHRRHSHITYEGIFYAKVKYYQRFDVQNATIDTIRKAINTDLNLMKDYVLGHDTLAFDNLEHARGIPALTLSEYKGEIEEIPGLTLVSRTMTCTIDILDYSVP